MLSQVVRSGVIRQSPNQWVVSMTSFRRASWLLFGAAVALSNCIPMSAQETIRVATFNVSLYGDSEGEVLERLRAKGDAQATKIAAIVQTVRPDILLLNEIDYDSDGVTLNLLNTNYFAVNQHGKQSMEYPYCYPIPSNTGITSDVDIDGDGDSSDPGDAWGYGVYPGQYAMAIVSRFPLVLDSVRSFQRYRWRDLPNALRPYDADGRTFFYNDQVWNQLRLSSKNHVDVPVRVGNHLVHLLASHPTPPVFDGPDDHNGCRNHDEIRFWTDYLASDASHLMDDRGVRGGLLGNELFVIAGDLNSDPDAGDSRRTAIRELLSNPRAQDANPGSLGAAEASNQTKVNATSSFGGNRFMRLDYVLPSRNFKILKAGVFWPSSGNQDRKLIDASDHRMVWIEVELP